MCIDLYQTGFVGKGSDHLQLIKFWPSCAPGKGVCGGAKFFGSALLQPARSVCVSLSAFFHHVVTSESRHDRYELTLQLSDVGLYRCFSSQTPALRTDGGSCQMRPEESKIDSARSSPPPPRQISSCASLFTSAYMEWHHSTCLISVRL